jgi:hypothetical protein
MNHQPNQRQFARGSLNSALPLAVIALSILALAPGAFHGRLAAADKDGAGGPGAVAEPARKPFPQIVKTIPKQGAIDVEPSLTEISVTFDRDMDQGMSWTGGPPLFPPTDKSRPARWTDARTCVLPVTLKKGALYQVGINSASYQNFADTSGVPVPAAIIAFVTTGATTALKNRVRVPKIVSLSPENGAMNVDPETKSLIATFDLPMGEGMSWTGSGPSFPSESPDGKKATWSKDRKQCTLPVTLEAGHEYELGLNSRKHINFQSKWGVALEPIVYKFRTQDAK